MTVGSDRVGRGFNRPGATQAVPLDLSKPFDKMCYTGLPKLKSYGILGGVFGLILSSFSNRQAWVALDGKSLQACLVNPGVPQGSIFGPTFFLQYI